MKLTQSGIKHYVIVCSLLVVISTGFRVITLTPAIKHDLAVSAEEIIKDFPSDLTLTISPDGIASNKAFPLIAQTPSALKGLPKTLVVIDPNGEVDMLQKYDALMLINNSYVIVGDGDTVQTASLSDFPQIDIDYATMQKLSGQVLLASRNAYLFTTAAFGLIKIFDLFIARVLYLLVFSLGLFAIYRGSLKTYSKAFQTAAHTVVPPLVLLVIFNLVGLEIPFSAWFIFLHTALTFFFLSRLEETGNIKYLSFW